jgi:hypothetical protein
VQVRGAPDGPEAGAVLRVLLTRVPRRLVLDCDRCGKHVEYPARAEPTMVAFPWPPGWTCTRVGPGGAERHYCDRCGVIDGKGSVVPAADAGEGTDDDGKRTGEGV